MVKAKAKQKKPDKEVLESLVLTAKRDFSRYFENKKILENPSRVLEKTKEGSRLGLDLFREMEGDDQIGSDLNIRRLKVSSFPFDVIVEDGTDKDIDQAKELKRQITPIYRKLLKEAQDALVCGYSITELFWEVQNGRVELPKVKGHIQEEFRFTADGEILWVNESGNTIPVNPDRVLAFTFDERKGNRFGRSLLSGCFWPWFFKKHGWLFWSNYLEKFGQPTVVGKYPAGTHPDKIDLLFKACQAVQNEMAVTLEKEWSIELLEAQRSGALDSYEKFIKYCDRCISKVILMTVLTSNESQFGTRAQAEVHKDLSDECIEDDALGFADALTEQVVKLLALWNYNFTVQPRLVIQYATEDTSKEEAEKDEILSKIVPISTNYIYSKYNIPEPGDDDEVVFNQVLAKKKDILNVLPVENEKKQNDNADFSSEFSGGADESDDDDRFILEENEYIESLYTSNLENLKKAYDFKELEWLLNKADNYLQAILPLKDFRSKDLAGVWEKHLLIGRLLGEYSVQNQINEASKADYAEFAAFDDEAFKKLVAKDAVKWFRGRVSVTGDIWKILDDEVKQSAFYVSQVEDLNLINYVKQKMIKALREGIPFRAFCKQLFLESGVDPFFGNMYTSYHTNMYSALAAQNEVALLRNRDKFPFWRYSAVMDNRTRPAHAAMHDIVARFDDSFWKIWSPPNGYNCRCRKVIAFNYQVERGLRKNRQMGYLKMRPDPGWDTLPHEGLFQNYLKLINLKTLESMRLNKEIREILENV